MTTPRRWPWRLTAAVTLALALAVLGGPASAQTGNSPTKTTSRILYHDGPVMRNSSNVYLIWYGSWGTAHCGQFGGSTTEQILTEFVTNLGSSPYFLINAGYPNANGDAPSGELICAGSALDPYSHGPTLTKTDLGEIVADQIQAGTFPLDTTGIYVVLTSADVSVDDTDTHFCLTCCQLHGQGLFSGVNFQYVFVGNPQRCPASCAAQFSGGQPTPNGNLAADAMASWLAHALSGTVTNPTGTGWYDRYGLENSDKCQGTYGETYLTATGARANIWLGGRDYLLQQNWVNGRKGHCAMSWLD